MAGASEQTEETKVLPDSPRNGSELDSISLPQMGLEKALTKIIPEVTKSLGSITPDNVHKQREFILETVAQAEERLLYVGDSKVTNLLRKLRAVALGAFVKSFEVAQPSPVDLINFCREYVPDVRLKKGNDTTIKVNGLLEEIGKLSKVGAENVRTAIGTISAADSKDLRTVEKILTFLPDKKS